MIRMRFVLILFVVTLFAGNGNPVFAQNPGARGKGKTSKGQQNPVTSELHAARQLLENANHDYSGHRAKAVHDVSSALHLLGHSATAQGQKSNGGKKNGTKPAKPQKNKTGSKTGQGIKNEPQSVSDAQLKKAAQIITVAMGQIPANQAQARNHLQDALREISTALTIR